MGSSGSAVARHMTMSHRGVLFTALVGALVAWWEFSIHSPARGWLRALPGHGYVAALRIMAAPPCVECPMSTATLGGLRVSYPEYLSRSSEALSDEAHAELWLGDAKGTVTFVIRVDPCFPVTKKSDMCDATREIQRRFGKVIRTRQVSGWTVTDRLWDLTDAHSVVVELMSPGHVASVSVTVDPRLWNSRRGEWARDIQMKIAEQICRDNDASAVGTRSHPTE